MALQIGMFAYTGLTPVQMDKLAKEVSTPLATHAPSCHADPPLTSILCTPRRTVAYR